MLKRILLYVFGLTITALGMALIIRSPFGAGPWDTVGVGLNKHFGLTIGIWLVITQGMIIFITAFIERARPRIEAALVVIVRSWLLDVWFYFILIDVVFPTTFIGQLVVFILGVICLGVGIGIYIEAYFPKSPNDEFMIALSNRFKLSLNFSRQLLEISGMAIGFLVGGPVGLGTIFIALSLGQIIQVSNRWTKQILHSLKRRLKLPL